ncbi:hypothetical protein BGZ70_006146 [Mortierella alpina]|uniref:ER-bound oxygenase mpaB/mpaB'/Rubber oxygenase catalytic domain-containing protein n=1 Tax=Mortierella alpina TaxID=64518 RepID=A0A9P6JEA8_MORAP|nr:hypothetical protein BGZ70_006146 [Mortierella alpina]
MSCPAGYTFDSTPRVAPISAATENFKPGQRLQYCDYHTIWTENHLPASKLEPLRSLGDPLSDDALAALEIQPGEDALEALLAYTSQPSDKQTSPAPHQLLTHVMTIPDWVDWDRIQRGQKVYWRYCLYITVILLHFTVASGFSIPKIMKVLSSTGYLPGKKAQKRVLETGQFVLDVFHSPESLQPGSGIAWKSMVQIRLLHSAVRARLSKIAHAHSKYYNLEEYGVPINQEDLLGVLFSLSNTMWRIMEKRLDVHMTTQEREDYLHVWRYVGHTMGVDDVLGATQTPQRADACLDSIVMHIADPGTESGRLASTLFRNMDPRSEPLVLLDRYKIHLALAERLFGPELWKVNGLPPITWPYRVVRELIYSLMSLDLWLVTNSPQWFRLRSSLVLKAKNRIIARKLGKRRTQFELKEMPASRVAVIGKAYLIANVFEATYSSMLRLSRYILINYASPIFTA